MSRSQIEIRVGFFVFLGLSLLCAMIIMFGFRNIQFIRDTYRLTAVFSFTNGIIVGAPVRFSGVDVGKVKAIEFSKDPENAVYLYMDIRNGVVIRKDARLIVNSLGILGEKYLEFIPRSSTTEPMLEGEKIKGEEPLPLNDVVSEALNLISDVRAIMSETFNESTRENIRLTIRNIRDLTDKENQLTFRRSLKNLSRLTGKKTQSEVHSALTGFDSATAAVRSLIEDHREDVNDIFTRIKSMSTAFDEISNKLNTAQGTIGLLISNPKLHNDLDQALVNFDAWISMVRKHGLLYKEKEPDKAKSSASQTKDNKGFFSRRK